LSTWLVSKVSNLLANRTDRRGFLARTAVVGSALAVDPFDYLLHPGTAYAYVCRCGDTRCGCGSACCDGYTEFCCTLTGSNTCPPGTFAGGWWRADGSMFCGGGPRYYIDCHAECPTSDGPAGICVSDDGLTCGCALGDCHNRAAGCVAFRYGQCHQEIAQSGRIACRVVTCTPAYLLDNACTATVMVDQHTANHNAPCLQAPPTVGRAYATAAVPGGAGLWAAGPDGSVVGLGGAAALGSVGRPLAAPVVGIAAAPDGAGYWLAGADGAVFPFGSARLFGSMAGQRLNAPIVTVAATPDGYGYWMAASDGGVFSFGSARFFGSMGGHPLALPIVGMAPAPDGRGYWLVASDGGVFTFGSARFYGSTGGRPLRALAGGLVPTPTGAGYWVWGHDGSVFAFGDATDAGDYPRLAAASRTLPADGIDAFQALALGGPLPTTPAPGSSPGAPGTGGTGTGGTGTGGTPGGVPPGGAAPPSAMARYTLWAFQPLGPPPVAVAYPFGTVPAPA